VIDRAPHCWRPPLWLLAPVVTHEGIAGLYCGEVHDAWRHAAALSRARHIVWVDEPFDRCISMHAADVRRLVDGSQGRVQGRARDSLKAARS
jgi:hypothetical protein